MTAIIKAAQHSKQVALSVQSFNNQCDFTDLCFVCARGHKLYAHKLLLCTVSSKLKQIFLELPDNLETITVHLPDVEVRILGLVLDFLYEGSVRVNKSQYAEFQEVMNLLYIVLTTPSDDAVQTTSQPPPQPPPAPPQQPAQPPQMLYLPVAPNNQGQVQYMLAQPNLAQGQMIPVSSVVQGNMVQQPTSQPIMISTTGCQMVQAGPQVVQASGQVVQAGGQVVQAGGQVVQQTQVQQTNMMQMVQQNNGQVVPMNSQMVAGGQMVAGNLVGGNQMVQCSSQMVVQGNQQTMMNNNQMQVGMQNQVIQQRPTYVTSSTSNQLTTSTRGPHQYTQSVTQGRSRGTPQVNRIGNVSGERVKKEDILSILEENCDPSSLTAKKIQACLEQKLNRDLSGHEPLFEEALRKWKAMNEEEIVTGDISSEMRVSDDLASNSLEPTVKRTRGRKPKIPFSKSDDERDEDFDPKKKQKKSVGRRKIKPKL